MQTRIVAALFILAIWLEGCGSIPSTTFRLSLPAAGEISKIEVACHVSSETLPLPQPIVVHINEPHRIALVREELGALSNAWTSWGIVALPAPDVRMEVTYSSSQRIWFATTDDFSVLWNEKGRRVLSEPERSRLRQLLPQC